MTVSDCVRMALAKAGIKLTEMVKEWGLSSPQALNNKFIRGSWSAEDLAHVAAFTGGELVIEYPDGQKILIRPDRPKSAAETAAAQAGPESRPASADAPAAKAGPRKKAASADAPAPNVPIGIIDPEDEPW